MFLELNCTVFDFFKCQKKHIQWKKISIDQEIDLRVKQMIFYLNKNKNSI